MEALLRLFIFLIPVSLLSQVELKDSIDQKFVQIIDYYRKNNGHLGQDGPVPIHVHKTSFFHVYYASDLDLNVVDEAYLEDLDSCLFFIKGFGSIDFVLEEKPDFYFYHHDRMILVYNPEKKSRTIDKRFIKKIKKSFNQEQLGYVSYPVWGLRLFRNSRIGLVRIKCDDCILTTR